jgi:hypothetical protein
VFLRSERPRSGRQVREQVEGPLEVYMLGSFSVHAVGRTGERSAGQAVQDTSGAEQLLFGNLRVGYSIAFAHCTDSDGHSQPISSTDDAPNDLKHNNKIVSMCPIKIRGPTLEPYKVQDVFQSFPNNYVTIRVCLRE